jgi:nucleoside 2-deoxyribosyltransferase
MAAVYLAGPINQCSDLEAKAWRLEATALLHRCELSVLDPMVRDYRGMEAKSARVIVETDTADIRRSSAVLAKVDRPTWGTAMEIFLAASIGLPVVTFGNCDEPSPWVIHHSRAHCRTLSEAVCVIARLVG